ncbi:MAG: hypothetical protein M3Z23_07915 [Acidobacteriota bacterium]|nr:hypothetical protein [Acidobacteriota bacterium]
MTIPTLTLTFALLLAQQSTTGGEGAAQAQEGKPAKNKGRKGSAAEQYAAALATLLKSYKNQLSVKIQAEQQAYIAAAKLYDDAFRADIFDSLRIDRTVDSQTDQLALETGGITPEKFLENLKQYTQHDFDQTRTAFQLSVDSYTTYLSNLDGIQADSQKVTVLIDILNDLATKPKWGERLAEIKGYSEDFVKQSHFSDCSLSDSLLSIASSRKSTLDNRLEAVKKQIGNTTGDAELKTLAAQQEALKGEQGAAQSEAARLTARRTNSGSYTAGANGANGKCEVK